MAKVGMMALPFGTLLQSMRLQAGLSQNGLAKAAHINPAHINRAEHGTRAMSRPLVLVVSDGLNLTDDDRDRLLYAAGHAPGRNYQEILDEVLSRLSEMRTTWPEVRP